MYGKKLRSFNLCLNKNIANQVPKHPLIRENNKSVLSEILHWCIVALNLSKPNIKNVITLVTNRYTHRNFSIHTYC